MTLSSQLFFAVLITGITGSIMLGLWLAARKLFLKWNPNLLYYMLRLTCVLFLLPLGYALILMFYKGSIIMDGAPVGLGNFMITGSMKALIEAIALLWGIAASCILAERILQAVSFADLCKSNVSEETEEILTELERIKDRLGIRRSVCVYRNKKIKIPVVSGIRNQKILLPTREYTKEEITIIFYHELLHGKYHDVFYKFLSVLVTILHCYNPMAHRLKYEINEWSEFCCDWNVKKYALGEFTVKEYYSKIMEFVEECEEREAERYGFAGLFIDRSTLKRRVEWMNQYQDIVTTVKYAGVIAMILMIYLSGVTAYASGRSVVAVHNFWYTSTERTSREAGTISNEQHRIIPKESMRFFMPDIRYTQNNVDQGELKVQVTARGLNNPIPNARITISYSGDPEGTVEEVNTDVCVSS